MPIFWVQKQDIGPIARTGHGMAYDAARQRVIVFGGDPGGPPLGDTWEWDGSLWTQVTDIGPSARHGLSLAAHGAPAASRLVLFGGASGAELLGDTWTYDGTDWIQVADTGPQARAGHAVAYDSTRQRLVLFGGQGAAPLGDTWEWNGAEWTQVEDIGPSARRGHAMAFDAARGRVILFGGAGANGTGLDDTWAWDGSSWTQIADTGPDGRTGASMSGGGSVLLFGGVNSIDPALGPANRVLFADTWQLTTQGWVEAQDIGPVGRWGHGAAVKSTPAPSRVVMFGGATAFGAAEDPALVPDLRNDTWEVPEPAGGGVGPAAPIQITAVNVQPPQIMPFAPAGTVVQVTITASAMPPAGTVPVVSIVRGPAPNWQPQQPPGFAIPPVAFNGTSAAISFPITRDGGFLGVGQYGVAAQLGTGPRVVGLLTLA